MDNLILKNDLKEIQIHDHKSTDAIVKILSQTGIHDCHIRTFEVTFSEH